MGSLAQPVFVRGKGWVLKRLQTDSEQLHTMLAQAAMPAVPPAGQQPLATRVTAKATTLTTALVAAPTAANTTTATTTTTTTTTANATAAAPAKATTAAGGNGSASTAVSASASSAAIPQVAEPAMPTAVPETFFSSMIDGWFT